MDSNKKLCPYCNKEINPGDQKCVFCGEKIPNVSLSISDLTHQRDLDFSENSQKIHFIFKMILLCVFFIIGIFLIVWFWILKR